VVYPVFGRWCCGAASFVIAGCLGSLLSGAAYGQSDWDAVMLDRVNRARTDPALENSIQGTNYSHSSVTPLAYQPQVAAAAANHNTWMHLNIGNNALDRTAPPRSFAHHETNTGGPVDQGGTALTGSPGYTGAGIGDRVTAAGFSWSRAGENIIARWSAGALPVDEARMDQNHTGWWNSQGHRNNMMNGDYRVFGHHAESRSITPDGDNNFPAGFNELHLATQNFARPQYWNSPDQYLFGLMYRDRNDDADWTPRDAGDPLREGLAGLNVTVYDAVTDAAVTSAATFDNGAFSIPAAVGDYHLKFTGGDLPGPAWWVKDVSLASAWNTDLGHIRVVDPGDMNGDGNVDGLDIDPFVQMLTGGGSFDAAGDTNGDGTIDGLDIDPFVGALTGAGVSAATIHAAIPEPGSIALLLVAAGGTTLRRRI